MAAAVAPEGTAGGGSSASAAGAADGRLRSCAAPDAPERRLFSHSSPGARVSSPTVCRCAVADSLCAGVCGRGSRGGRGCCCGSKRAAAQTIVDQLKPDILKFHDLSAGNIESIGLLFSESECLPLMACQPCPSTRASGPLDSTRLFAAGPLCVRFHALRPQDLTRALANACALLEPPSGARSGKAAAAAAGHLQNPGDG